MRGIFHIDNSVPICIMIDNMLEEMKKTIEQVEKVLKDLEIPRETVPDEIFNLLVAVYTAGRLDALKRSMDILNGLTDKPLTEKN